VETEMIQDDQNVESHRVIRGYNSYAQAHQDLFVAYMHSFKLNGLYVEIGAADPKQSSNSYLLESEFGWDGFSVEIDYNLVSKFNEIRRNKCVAADATEYDFKAALEEKGYPLRIDYLSLDIDPALSTYNALRGLPLADYRFSVITYEHDSYLTGFKYMNASRNLLESYGYVRVVSNVLCCGRDFEDWYIDPMHIPSACWKPFVSSKIECKDVFDLVS